MSQTQAHPDKHKQPSKVAKEAMHEADAHVPGESADPVPAPDRGNHAHSHAAHPDVTGHADTKPAGDLRHGVEPGALRQPPQEVTRSGKQNRK